MQIIPFEPTFGQSFGKSLGESLETLAHGKLEQIHRRNKEKSLASVFGPDLAKTLSHLNPQEFGYALKYLGQQGAGQQQTGQPSYDQEQASYLLGQPQAQQAQQTYSQPQAQAFQQAPVQEIAKKAVQSAQASPTLNRPTAQPTVQAAAQKQATMQQLAGTPTAQMPAGTQGMKLTPELITQQGPQNVAKVGMAAPVKKAAPLTVQEFQQMQKPAQVQPKVAPVTSTVAGKEKQERPAPSIATIEMGYKKNKPFLDELSKNAKEARENNMRLQRIEELDKTGNLQNPALASVLETLHLDFPALMSKESQELKKLSSDFVKGAKSIFGSRITNADLKVFMNTVPTLTQTKEGRAAVIRNWKMLNEGTFAREKAANDIIEENGGVPPINLKHKVEERIAPELDAISKRFVLGDNQEFKVGQTLNELPKNPSVGMVLESPKGDIKWNGKNWVKA